VREKYQFTNTWFDAVRPIWDELIPRIRPAKILEIGTYEGASACYLIDKLGREQKIELHCIDSWEGGIEHQAGGSAETDMPSVEQRFARNVAIASAQASGNVDLRVHKGRSDVHLSRLLAEGAGGSFDLVYVDGSHEAPDVLCDAVLGFRLLKKGGFMFLDDYLWAERLPGGVDPIRSPKIAIDAFTNIYCRKIGIVSAQLYQLYVQKVSD
jgi:predicted O-methyltransferase YrrM